MFLAKIKKRVVATAKHPAYQAKRVFAVKRIQPDGTELDEEWLAMDYVGAGPGDTVICGGAPGVAREVFELERAPVRTLIVAIVDRIDVADKLET